MKLVNVIKEQFAVKIAFIILFIELFSFGIIYRFIYKKGDEIIPNTHVTEIEILTIIITFTILITAISYWSIFYHGSLSRWYPTLHIKTHATEAFLMYTMLYMFGIGLLLPVIKFMIYDKNDYDDKNYSTYPLVFISMLFGYYLYENIKVNLNKKTFLEK